jgi:hypothetical protein
MIKLRYPRILTGLIVYFLVSCSLILASADSSLAHPANCPAFYEVAQDANTTEAQLRVQRGEGYSYPKERGREFADYNLMIVQSGFWRYWKSKITKYLGDKAPVNLKSILEALHLELQRNVRWVDVSGGLGVALRQAGLNNSLRDKVSRTNIDIVDWSRDFNIETPPVFDLNQWSRLSNEEKVNFQDGYIRHVLKAIFKTQTVFEQTAPEFQLGDAQTVVLKKPADLITIVEASHYYPDKWKAIVNLFNQLSENGVLVVTGSVSRTNKQMSSFIASLKAQGVTAFTDSQYVDSIMLVRQPGQLLKLNSRVKSSLTTDWGAIEVTYELIAPNHPWVEVTTQPAP